MDAGTNLAHYEILAKIGAGGMGEVYRARDMKLDRDVDLKILPDAFTRDADHHARFHREAQALASFSHPHVAGLGKRKDEWAAPARSGHAVGKRADFAFRTTQRTMRKIR